MVENNTPLRVGIVGCGSVARMCHLKALDALSQYEVRILCDTNERNALDAGREYGLSAATSQDYRELAGKVDVAIVCVWPRDHRAVTCDLLEMGIDVLCEKPVALRSEDAAAMAEVADRKGRILAIGHWCRFLKSSWLLRKVLGLGMLGQILEVNAEFGGELQWPMATGAYFDRTATIGGVMFDAGIHVLDLIVWLFGDIGKIAFQDDSLGGVEANGIIRGVLAVDDKPVPCRIAASWTHALSNGVRIRGSLGSVEARFGKGDQVELELGNGDSRTRLCMLADDLEVPFTSSDPYEAQLENFECAVRTRCSPITPAASTIVPLRVIEASYAVRKPLIQPWVVAGAEAI